MFLPIEIFRSGKKGVKGGGGIILQKNFLLKILFDKSEIQIIIESLGMVVEKQKAKNLKEKIERMVNGD